MDTWIATWIASGYSGARACSATNTDHFDNGHPLACVKAIKRATPIGPRRPASGTATWRLDLYACQVAIQCSQSVNQSINQSSKQASKQSINQAIDRCEESVQEYHHSSQVHVTIRGQQQLNDQIMPKTKPSRWRYKRRVFSEAVGPISLNLLGGTKTGEPILLNLFGGTLKVLTTNLYIYWGQRQGSLGL